MSSQQGNVLLARVLKDAVVAVALAATLAIVCTVDLAMSSGANSEQGSSGKETVVGDGAVIDDVEEKEHVEITQTPPQRKPLRLAVTPRQFDDMGALLDKLGEGYRYDNIRLEDLLDREKLGQYDVIFLTCGTDPHEWMGIRVGESERGATVHMAKQEVVEQVRDSLRSFVRQGGMIYASDWRFNLLQWSFPEFVDRSGQPKGAKQHVEAEVVDGGLREVLGPSIDLNFDKDGWYPASFDERDAEVYLRGSFKTLEGEETEKPLLVKIPFGEGEIFYTAFHNETQNSEKEVQLLNYLIFTMVTSHVESKVRETMVRGGFSPQKQSLLSTSAGDPSVTKTYRSNSPGLLQFVLAFENRGALLHLKVVGPGGQQFEKEGAATLQIEVPNAEVGDWTYTVTAKNVPFENFPFKLTVWQK